MSLDCGMKLLYPKKPTQIYHSATLNIGLTLNFLKTINLFEEILKSPHILPRNALCQMKLQICSISLAKTRLCMSCIQGSVCFFTPKMIMASNSQTTDKHTHFNKKGCLCFWRVETAIYGEWISFQSECLSGQAKDKVIYMCVENGTSYRWVSFF